MLLPVTLTVAAAAGIGNVVLAMRIVQLRLKGKVLIGDGGDERAEGGQADGWVGLVLGGELEEASAFGGVVAEDQPAEPVGLRLVGRHELSIGG